MIKKNNKMCVCVPIQLKKISLVFFFQFLIFVPLFKCNILTIEILQDALQTQTLQWLSFNEHIFDNGRGLCRIPVSHVCYLFSPSECFRGAGWFGFVFFFFHFVTALSKSKCPSIPGLFIVLVSCQLGGSFVF